MPRRLLFPSLVLLTLVGCQGPNPYVAQSLPEAATPVSPVQNPAAYPAAPLDWSRYRSWSWAPGASLVSGGVDGATVQQAVADGLDQRGLRPAQPGTRPDVQVRARLTQQQRTEQYTDYYDSGYGPYDPGPYGYGGPIAQTRTRTWVADVLAIELLDPATGRLLWQSAAERPLAGSPAERAQGLRESVRQVLANFPPS